MEAHVSAAVANAAQLSALTELTVSLRDGADSLGALIACCAPSLLSLTVQEAEELDNDQPELEETKLPRLRQLTCDVPFVHRLLAPELRSLTLSPMAAEDLFHAPKARQPAKLFPRLESLSVVKRHSMFDNVLLAPAVVAAASASASACWPALSSLRLPAPMPSGVTFVSDYVRYILKSLPGLRQLRIDPSKPAVIVPREEEAFYAALEALEADAEAKTEAGAKAGSDGKQEAAGLTSTADTKSKGKGKAGPASRPQSQLQRLHCGHLRPAAFHGLQPLRHLTSATIDLFLPASAATVLAAALALTELRVISGDSSSGSGGGGSSGSVVPDSLIKGIAEAKHPSLRWLVLELTDSGILADSAKNRATLQRTVADLVRKQGLAAAAPSLQAVWLDVEDQRSEFFGRWIQELPVGAAAVKAAAATTAAAEEEAKADKTVPLGKPREDALPAKVTQTVEDDLEIEDL